MCDDQLNFELRRRRTQARRNGKTWSATRPIRPLRVGGVQCWIWNLVAASGLRASAGWWCCSVSPSTGELLGVTGGCCGSAQPLLRRGMP